MTSFSDDGQQDLRVILDSFVMAAVGVIKGKQCHTQRNMEIKVLAVELLGFPREIENSGTGRRERGRKPPFSVLILYFRQLIGSEMYTVDDIFCICFTNTGQLYCSL